MSTRPFLRILTFISASAIVGLAAAFIAVIVRPELIARRAPPPQPAPAPSAGTAPRRAAGPWSPAPRPEPPRAANSYAEAVERAAPAVVNIYTARLVTERIQPNAIEELFGDARPRYRQRLEQSLGSGVIVDSAGARDHQSPRHRVGGPDPRAARRRPHRRCEDRRPRSGHRPRRAAARPQERTSPSCRSGIPTGCASATSCWPSAIPSGLSQTVTQGIVSATGRGQLGVATFENFIQTDAPINVGNSGGALINADGELIGINTAVLAKNLGVEGIGFAIPVNLVRGVMSEILTKGRVVRGWIGIVPADIDQIEARRFNLPQPGVVVAKLYVGSPAAEPAWSRATSSSR